MAPIYFWNTHRISISVYDVGVIIFAMIATLVFLTIAGIIVGLNRILYNAIENYDRYGMSPREDWIQFERMKMSGRN